VQVTQEMWKIKDTELIWEDSPFDPSEFMWLNSGFDISTNIIHSVERINNPIRKKPLLLNDLIEILSI